MKIDLAVSGDRAIEGRLDQLPAAVHQRLVARMRSVVRRLAARVRGRVPRRTGQLASQIRDYVDETPGRVRGRVSAKSGGGKAAALEFGARRSANVRQHSRTMTQVFGRATAPFEAMVDRYSRRTNIPAHRFLRGPFSAMRDDIRRELAQAVDEGVRKP